MNLTPQDLRDVEAASKREREHYTHNVRLHVLEPVCYCPQCKVDRETIAKHTPEVMRLLRDYMRTQVRGDACGGMG
jgi:hypothetical protein